MNKLCKNLTCRNAISSPNQQASKPIQLLSNKPPSQDTYRAAENRGSIILVSLRSSTAATVGEGVEEVPQHLAHAIVHVQLRLSGLESHLL